MDTTPKPYGGYAITALKMAGGEETPRFEAYLTKDGKKIAHVSNGGFGGSHSYHPFADGPEGWEALRAFEAYATEWNKGDELAGFEDDDQLVYRLIEVAALNKKRCPVFVLNDEDYFRDGRARTFAAGTTHEQALSALRHPKYASRSPRIWDKTRSEFVPAV